MARTIAESSNLNYGFVYETTNLINGKKYIGKHKRTQNSNDPDDSWYLGSGNLIVGAVNKYGVSNFSRKILCECSTEEDLQEKERYDIRLYDAVNSDSYYNLVEDANPPLISGESHHWFGQDHSGKNNGNYGNPSGFTHTEEWKSNQSEYFTLHNPMKDPQVASKLTGESNGMYGVSRYGEDNGFYGKHHTEEWKEQKSLSMRGNLNRVGKVTTEETRRRQSESLTGRKLSEGHRKHIGDSQRGVPRSKDITYNLSCRSCGESFVGRLPSQKYCEKCKERRNS